MLTNPLVSLIRVAAEIVPVASRSLSAVPNRFSDLLQSSEPDSPPRPAEPSPHRLADTASATPGAEQTRITTLRRQLDRSLSDLHKTLREELGQRGADLSEPAELAIDPLGHILEMTGHWDRGLIEQALKDDPELAGKLRSVIQQAAALRQAESPAESTGQPGEIRIRFDAYQALIEVS